ncbi:MAG: AAA family ATPase [Candidatus Calescibacterium sp.]|nr:AAA family ATPase [Candidatus Calescibacterium sp.]
MRIGKKLPIGIQSFEEMRTNGYYYVDKTYFVSKLASEGKYYFLSRPRRFGKSLFLDTLRQAFLGKKKLFEGLYLENNWNWDEFHPVILINFGDGVVEDEKNLEEVMSEILLENAENYGVKLRKRLINYRLKELIVSLYEKYRSKVVVLIDEYDKPILDRIEGESETVLRIREKLKNFYSVLKGADEYLRFVFITGVSKFSKVSLFSGINQLQDITLNREYATICGYTQKEFEEVFAPELAGLNLEDIRTWYNGYSWLGEPVYNPFDVLLYLSEKVFRPYWFETGTPAFLVKLLINKRFHIPDLESLFANENLLGYFDIDFIEPENLLFQTGYLTIRKLRKLQRELSMC